MTGPSSTRNPPTEEERLVIAVRLRRSEPELTREWVEQLLRRGEALGGRVVAWQPTLIAFDFEPESFEDAIDLCADLPPESAAGLSSAPLACVLPGGSRVALSLGPALSMAVALARIARADEVLVDPQAPVARRGDLLTRGARVGVIGRERFRGLRLDRERPLRPTDAALPAAWQRPPWVERAMPDLPSPGQASYLVVSRGGGGSRMLAELAASTSERTLTLEPSRGRPLGGLASALARAESPALGRDDQAQLERLLRGEWLDSSALASLLEAWLGPGGLVLVDDADRVDRDSVDAVLAAVGCGSLRAVLRVAERAASVGSALELPPLGERDRLRLVHSLVGSELAEEEVLALVRRGGSTPLGVLFALADSIEGGLLVREAGALVSRIASSRRHRAEPLRRAVARRLGWLSVTARDLVAALAVLDDFAPTELLVSLTGESEARVAAALDELCTRHFVLRSGDRVRLAQTSLSELARELLTEADLAQLHRAASRACVRSSRPADAAAAGVHALLGGDVDGALPLLRRAAAGLRQAGCLLTATALERFTESGDVRELESRGLLGGVAAGSIGSQRASVPPQAARFEPREPVTGSRFVQAFRVGDHAAVSELVSELKAGGAEPHVALRFEGMASLARGEVARAVGQLRQAKELAQAGGPSERGRAALAFGLALAQAGRAREALLEALESLACAREAGDPSGEVASLRFAVRVSEQAGASEAARQFAAAAERPRAP